MSGNVVKFRKIEKKSEPKPPRKALALPSWALFAVLVALALVIYAAQRAGFLAG
ncbi:MAG: hypothetical protein MO846_02980 [Candidatus Devosia symbiotica]|nr:hypothetical protein [Candidatus Devosia symbiotica]